MRIQLPVPNQMTRKWNTVQADIVDVAPHLAHIGAFAVHQTIGGWWSHVVSNVETGCCVEKSHGMSQHEAISKAREFLELKSPSQLGKAMQQARRVYGDYRT